MATSDQLSNKTYYCWLFVIVAAGALLRLGGALGDLWFDEIWQLTTVHQIRSILDQFDLNITAAQPSAYSVLLFLIGSDEPLPMRAPSLIFGILSIPLMAWLTLPRGRLESLVCTFIFSTSYLMVLYGSEARGYSAMVFCGLISWICLTRGLATGRSALAPLFWLSSLLAVLFQPVALQLYAGLLCWSVAHLAKRKFGDLIFGTLWWHGPAILGIGAYYALYLRHLSPLDGLMGSKLEVVLNAANFLLGGPQITACNPNIGLVSLAIAVLALIIIGYSITKLFKQRDDSAVLYLVAVFLAPIAMVIATNPSSFSVRYLLPAFVASIPVLGHFLVGQRYKTKHGLIFIRIVLAAIFVGNARYIWQLIQNGRAQYRQTLEHIISKSEKLPATVSSANDFRTEMILGYFKERLSKTGAITYHDADPNIASDWYLTHGYDPACAAKQHIEENGQTYELDRVFDCSAQSGWQWLLYKKAS